MAENSTVSAATGALYSFLLRILSFTLSQLTIRFVDPVTLGKASVRLELICSTTVLFLGREGIRLALLRVADGNPSNIIGKDGESSKNDERSRLVRVNNVMWLSVPISLFLTGVALAFHLYTYREQVSASQDEIDDYRMAGILYCFATAIEILSEPCMIACLRTMDVKTRAKAEAFASLGKALSCVLLLSSVKGENHAASFGFSQCIYALILTTALYVEKWNNLQLPSWIATSTQHGSVLSKLKLNFDMPTVRLSGMFSTQSIFKHLLTEGDRIVLTTLVGSYDSGVYAMASSYGGMASRLLFQPLEENGRLLFSNKHAFIMKTRQDKKDVNILLEDLEWTYCTVVKLSVYIGLVFAAFAYNYTSILLRLLAGARWGSNAEAAVALSAFCVYTALMALNGMTEAFLYGVAESGQEVGSLALAHGFVGFVFYIVAPFLVLQDMFGLGGTVGLVTANGLCMALRSMYSLHFAHTYFSRYRDHQSKWSRLQFMEMLLPKIPVIFSFLASFLITNQSRLFFIEGRQAQLLSLDTMCHLGIGIACFIVTSFLIYKLERDFGNSLASMVSKRRSKGIKPKSD